jgi:glycosyltransferase involved in cell wall biosynthesis
MRILHVNKFLYRRGGAEGYLLDVAALQRRQGHEVALFGMEHPANDPLPYERFFPPHVELEPPPPGAMRRARAVGRMLYSPASRHGLRKVIEDFRPDVVHLHNIYHQLSPAVLRAAQDAGVPAVMTLHDYKLVCPSYQLLDKGQICTACVTGGMRQAVVRRCKDDSVGASAVLALESWVHRTTGAYGLTQAFVSPSRFLAQMMTAAGVYPDRMHVVNHFADTQQTAVKQRPGGTVLYAGRLSPEKGVDVLVSALGQMSADVTLDVAGEGTERARLESLAAELAPGRVRFHGRLDKAALFDLMRAASVVAVPSRWYENQPMVVLEAFGCGLPVVTTDLGGLPELVDEGKDGLVVPANAPDALAAALATLTGDPDAAFAMGQAGRAKVTRDFSPEKHLRRLDQVYRIAAAALHGAEPASAA